MAELTIATANLAMPPDIVVFGGVAEHQDFLKATGYKYGDELADSVDYQGGGFEWLDVRSSRSLIENVGAALAADQDIGSLHQSWRSTSVGEIVGRLRTPWEGWGNMPTRAQEVAQALGRALIVPHIDGSLQRLESVQKGAGRLLPLVAYPNQQQPPEKRRFDIPYQEWTSRFAELRHQPTVETLTAWGVVSRNADMMIDDMLVRQQEFGFGGAVWDTKHGFEARHGMRFNDPEGMIQVLGSRAVLNEVHLNLTNDPRSLQAALEGGLHKTHHGHALEAAFESMPSDQELLIVTELTPGDFEAIGSPDVIEGHRQVIRSILALAA
ncbi:MAG TPA: hypothetical protein VK694_02355 [Verrucomicrobiae bacterium]|nr:hypothetical protein [Verrucomicrobiae bacterium]